MSSRKFIAPGLIVLGIAAAFRFPLLTANRFHPDEALYAYFARLIASGRDVLLHGEVVDKPPLTLYTMALSFRAFGASEFAARLPSLFASLISVALLMRLAFALYRSGGGRVSAYYFPALPGLIFALSPLAILFSPTIFPDPLMLLFALSSLLAAARKRWAWMGVAMGLAFASKQTALLMFPLVLAVAALHGFVSRNFVRNLARTILPLALIAAAVFLWDYLRHPSISFWAQGYGDNQPGRLIRSGEVGPRLRAWADLLWYFAPSAVFLVVVCTCFIALLAKCGGLPPRATRDGARRSAATDLLLAGFAVSFLGGYWLLAFNVWDRYVFVLTPVLSLLASRGLEAARAMFARFVPAHRLAVFLPVILMAWPALTATRTGYPIGGDTGAYDGIDQLAAHIQTLPQGAVLYDHWLGWELSFYSFDGPVYTSWFPDPQALTEDLRVFGRTSPRFLVAPAWEGMAEVREAAREAGFGLRLIFSANGRAGAPSFLLYQLDPISSP